MSDLQAQVRTAILTFLQENVDAFASEILKVYEEVHHALLYEQVAYGAEDYYYVKIIYRKGPSSVLSYYYHGTFGQLLRELMGNQDI